MTAETRIGLLGFGEVGQILADDLARVPDTALHAFDILFDDEDSLPSRAASAREHVHAEESAAVLAQKCKLIISAVTAAEDVAATRSIAEHVANDSFVMDLNSVAPGTKRRCADIVETSGARYVEAALMSPIGPKRIASPFLLGGPHAADFLQEAHALGFAGARVFSDAVGPASATKMCRSVIIKGMEALLAESMLSARNYGVEKAVLDSLGDLLVTRDWEALAHYMISRSVEHGVRRAEEMREVSATVADAGIEPLMSTACAQRQEWAARFKTALEKKDLREMLESIRSEMAC